MHNPWPERDSPIRSFFDAGQTFDLSTWIGELSTWTLGRAARRLATLEARRRHGHSLKTIADLCDDALHAWLLFDLPLFFLPELDTGLTLEECLTSLSRGSHDVNRAAPGRAPLPLDASSASSDAAVISTAVMLAACARELLPAPAASTSCSRPGIRSTVDRPPRA